MLQSRLSQIAAEIPVAADAVIEANAELLKVKAKERVPVGPGEVHLRDHIHTERGDSPGEWYVVAGDGEVFYGHIVEHGSVHSAPHPFLIPAAEEVRAEIQASRGLFRRLLRL
jgi:HK97 gp10 family phage protein